MSQKERFDLCVIGAGAGGLSVAAAAAQLGVKVALVERGKMGGDCLNYGCVPSKSLLAAAKVAQTVRDAGRFGVGAGEPKIDWSGVMGHVHGVIDAIKPHDSQERFENMGVRVFRAQGRFIDRKTIQAGDVLVQAKRFVIATGSGPAIPAIPGLMDVPYLTNETIFDLKVRPKHLVIVGGGPIGCELGQAFRRLGVEVTILQAFHLLMRDDVELRERLRQRLCDEGVAVHEGARVEKIEKTGEQEVCVSFEKDGHVQKVKGSHLLVATGRRPNVHGLGLDNAELAYTDSGIEVNNCLRTSNNRVFAIGDVTGAMPFTHVANYHAGIVVRNALFRMLSKVHMRAIPTVIYTDPELAQVGMLADAACKRYADAKVYRWEFVQNDRARAEGRPEGLIKVVTRGSGEVLGVTILGKDAGELIFPWIALMQRRGKIGEMAHVVAAYPTLSEVHKHVAGEFYRPKLFSPMVKRLVRWLGVLA